uniref:Protein phosphatase 1 regulatory subunit n=1 Tax=Ursus maritimus TaxID=29073 RepID=A0A452VKF2_URSMA
MEITCGNPFRKQRRRPAGELLPPGLSASPPLFLPFLLPNPQACPCRVPGKFSSTQRRVLLVRLCRFSEYLASPGEGPQAPVSPFLCHHPHLGSPGLSLRGSWPFPPWLTAVPSAPQACIDENLEVVRFLVEQGATVNQADNEGWTPLHVAASCGYLDIARYLLSHGANIAAVNSDGDLPLDLAESDAMEGLLKAEIAYRGVDVEAAKRAEEELLLHDTRCWLNGGAMPEARHPRTGASALHVAAAKGYIEVMRLLLQAGYDPELRDGDGWTPLHAAAHWGVEDACRLLAEHGGGMDSLTHAGQRPCDLADEDVLSLLEELARKQEDLRNQKEASQSRSQETQVPSSSKHRRSSVCRLSSREKISLQDLSKERRPGGAGGPPIQDEDEGEEGLTDTPPPESRTLNGVSSPPPPSPQGLMPPEEAPFSRRFGLQKTGSSGALGPTDRRGAEGTPGAGLQRSASSSRLEGTSVQAREPRLARITPTPSRKGPEPSALFEVSRRPPLDNSTPASRMPEPESPVKPNVPAASTAPPADSRDRRRSYQMPVRDEESESQRKARSRLMRQSRRSTQGVTLTDLKEAEKVAGKAPEPEKCLQSLDPSRRPRVPGVENSDGPAQREAPDGQGQGPQAAREHRKVGKEWRGLAEVRGGAGAGLTNPCGSEEGHTDLTWPPDLSPPFPACLDHWQSPTPVPGPHVSHLFQERRALERKAAELEEELKALSDLRADNQRLKDENAALIRVISKLSK